jgi:hypothetical protein
MNLGVYVNGEAVPVADTLEADSAASVDPYAAVFGAPELGLIYLLELEVRSESAT